MNHSCSIIIPIYNEENNIRACFNTILKQKYCELEIVFIDDGSTDGSASIINKIIMENINMNIKYIFQENNGAASARLTGIHHASSNFIAFLDCDDWLDEDSILLAMEEFTDPDIDFSLFNLLYTSREKNRITPFTYFTKEKKIAGSIAFKNSINSWGLHGFGIIRKEILLQSYNDYFCINRKKTNYLNNDEIITRLCFLNSKYISLSRGNYFFFNNILSTTKRINNNYCKVVYNSIILDKFISYNLNYNHSYRENSIDLVARTAWGIFIRYLKWKTNINKDIWIKALDESTKYYHQANGCKKIKQVIKMKIIRFYTFINS